MRALSVLAAVGLLACKGDPVPATDSGESAQPGELRAGVARVRVPAPVGIGTAGFGPFGAPDSESPFAEIYPATTRLHGHPEFKVVVLSRGDGFEAVFVRMDAVGTFQQLRRAVVLEVAERTGRDIDDALIYGATHTHSGPGRVVDGGGMFDVIADKFLPEFYDGMVDAMADGIEAAYADLQPARLGFGRSMCADGHSDRRCEDGLDYQNDEIPLVAVERNGQVDALVMAYAVHGTVLGIDDLTLSQDVSGAIEQAVEDGFDHPVEVVMFNSWGADMAPASPSLSLRVGAEQPEGFDQMEAIGSVVAEAVHASIDELEWQTEPEISLATHRVPINRDVIGYDDDTFPYEYGGLYCEAEGDCVAGTTIDDLDKKCLPFNADYPAPIQTVMTAGQLGPMHLMTFPGEPGTLLAEQVIDDLRAAHSGVDQVLFLGYTQDYLGYSILEDDWWEGGYEASGALWGPRQGEYLAGRAVDVFDAAVTGGSLSDAPEPIEPFADPVYTPYAPEPAVDVGAVLVDVEAAYGPTQVVSFTVAGSDPWLGPPAVHVEDATGAAVLRPNGVATDGDDYNFSFDLAPDPAYGDVDAPTARTFAWTIHFPVQHQVPSALALAAGDYQLVVDVPQSGGDPVGVRSAVFTVTEAAGR